jgi:aminoglycoside phosphotransferase (APT) family kinase protein
MVASVTTGSEVEVTAGLVTELLRDQHPDLAGLPVTFGARGWGNQLWRLGDDLAVRLPYVTRNSGGTLLKEHALVPALAPSLPLPVPVPQRLGQPSGRFPRPWTVTTWVAGEPADRAPATRGPEAADALAAFLTALHRPAPAGLPASQDGRGWPLARTRRGFEHFFNDVNDRGLIPDPDAARAVWEDAVAAPEWAGPPQLLHADLHPANLLTRDGGFCGVVDLEELCPGDPACDLAACWIVLPDGAVDRFYHGYAPAADEATRRRARGWALSKALVLLDIGDNGVHGRPGGKATWGPPAVACLRRLIAR